MITEPTLYRLPPEWAPNEYILLSWPHKDSDWAYMLDEVRLCFTQIVKSATRFAKVLIVAPDISEVANELKDLVNMDRIRMVEMPTNDTWARDFGMICSVSEDGRVTINDFKFDGWGLKFASCHDNLITRHILDAGLKSDDATYANRLGFVLEGGSIDIDEEGTLLTTSECLLSPNRNGDLSKSEIESRLKATLGCKRILWLDHGYLAGDDTDSHVDTLARFLPGKKIAYTACDRPDDEHYTELGKMEQQLKGFAESEGYNLVPLPIPDAIYDADRQRLPATYANFLIINNAVLLPVYGDSYYDELAISTLKEVLPHYDIVPINCLPLIQQHGSLHCVTMQIPHGALK